MNVHRRPTVATGQVSEFDAGTGLGTVTADDGTEARFHCTQIAGGTREIPVGARVSFTVLAGRGGRWEAGNLASTPHAGSADG
ncbi:MAG: cold shock domain-containing protein [Actinomycetota bacterium]|nr:cold shock domain-containing protein [Actinomycetota bacterium]